MSGFSLFNSVLKQLLNDNDVLDIILKEIATSKPVSPGNVYMNRHNFKKSCQQFWNPSFLKTAILTNQK